MVLEEMIHNKEVILRAARNAHWKIQRALQYCNQNLIGPRPYDKRNVQNIAALMIDVSNLSEQEKGEHFDREIAKIADAFEGRTPNVSEYIKQMYDNIAIDENIDWSDERRVENMLISLLTNQALTTITPDFPKETFELYPTKDDIKAMDLRIAKSDAMYYRLCGEMMKLDFRDEINKCVPLGIRSHTNNYGTPTIIMDYEITEAAVKASEQNNPVMEINATETEIAKKFFLENSIAVEDPLDGTIYSEDNYARDFLSSMTNVRSHMSVEQMMMDMIHSADKENGFDYSHMTFINGKSLYEIEEQMKRSRRYSNENVRKTELGNRLRKALTDGKSVVTQVNMSLDPNGSIRFDKKEVKVDLDKLNEIDRKETKYSVFRRILNWAKLWKIQRFPTNAERDARQEKVKASAQYQNAISALENKIVHTYNSIDPQTSSRPKLTNALPKLTLVKEEPQQTVEQTVEQTLTENKTQREPIPELAADTGEPKISAEPPKEHNSLVRNNDLIH